MLKVRLLNDGGYGDMENVKFPVIVEWLYSGVDIEISGSELIKVGANNDDEVWDDDYEYYFSLLSGEWEAINEE